ncbi:MAG TPA: FtsQ-type POTRA domain-containing protein [Streptosporangiaceae bacterium]|jgi:cell division protein FtsQ
MDGTQPQVLEPASEPARRDARASELWRTACFVFAALAIIGGLAWALLGSSLLVVRSVQVTGTHLVTRAAVLRAAGIQRGTPLIRVSGSAVARRVEKLTPVLSARVSRDWPDKIVIAVRERQPAFAVAVPGGYGLMDRYGVVVRTVPARPAGLPLLTAAGPDGSVLPGRPQARAAATVLRELPAKLRGRVRRVSAPAADAVTVRLTRGVTIVWGSTGSAAQKARALSILLRTGARYYDVSDPVVAVTKG